MGVIIPFRPNLLCVPMFPSFFLVCSLFNISAFHFSPLVFFPVIFALVGKGK